MWYYFPRALHCGFCVSVLARRYHLRNNPVIAIEWFTLVPPSIPHDPESLELRKSLSDAEGLHA